VSSPAKLKNIRPLTNTEVQTLLQMVLQAVLWIRMFLGLPDPDPSLFERTRIRILLSTSKKCYKNIDFN
jgi:hypothetical protein